VVANRVAANRAAADRAAANRAAAKKAAANRAAASRVVVGKADARTGSSPKKQKGGGRRLPPLVVLDTFPHSRELRTIRRAIYEGATRSFDALLDKTKASVFLATDRAHVLRETIWCCRKGGTISVPGVYIGFTDKIPFGALMNKGLTMKTGQTHMKRYTEKLLAKIDSGEIDPSFVITHNRPLEQGPELYRKFRDKEDGCIKVVLKPNESSS
jgi:threonine dehydrogenase-like Zn-dependent dehydrogenase